ncbi:MAG TPA: hypothetical protein VKB25_06305 [Conexibacter sp.]|nr:hypothetical protein [Conexibacter sp.]
MGYSIAALGLLAVAYTGVLVALDRNGAARAFVRRFWTEQGITVPAPMIQMRIMGGGWWSSGSSASRSCSERRSGESVRGLGGTLAAGAVGGAVGGAYNAAGTQIGVTPTQVGMGAIAGTAGGMAGGRSGLLLLRRSGERWSSSDRLGL